MFRQIAQFTKAANANELKKSPTPMNVKEVEFLCRMVISELMELVTTVISDGDDELTPKDFINICCSTADPAKKYTGKTDIEKIAAQLDAIVDLTYYCGNIIKKSTGMPDESLDEVFTEVHQANMKKIHPDGTVHRRADGKILKPEGWKEPDVNAVVERLIQTARATHVTEWLQIPNDEFLDFKYRDNQNIEIDNKVCETTCLKSEEV